MEAEKELHMRTPRYFKTFTTCVELLGRPVARIDKKVPINRPIPDIVEGALQNVALWALWDHLDVGQKQRGHIFDSWEDVEKQQE